MCASRKPRVVGPLFDLPYLGAVLAWLVGAGRKLASLVLEVVDWRGVAVGTAAYLAGYGLLVVLVSNFMPETPQWLSVVANALDVGLPTTQTIAGWVFYAAHGVQLRIPTGFGIEGFTTATRNPLNRGVARVLFVYPMLVLGLAGALAAREKRATADVVRAGGFVGLGYAVLMVAGAGTLAFTIDIEIASVTIEPVRNRLFYVGTVGYPVAGGVLGAVLADRYDLDDLPVVGRFLSTVR